MKTAAVLVLALMCLGGLVQAKEIVQVEEGLLPPHHLTEQYPVLAAPLSAATQADMKLRAARLTEPFGALVWSGEQFVYRALPEKTTIFVGEGTTLPLYLGETGGRIIPLLSTYCVELPPAQLELIELEKVGDAEKVPPSPEEVVPLLPRSIKGGKPTLEVAGDGPIGGGGCTWLVAVLFLVFLFGLAIYLWD